jgi:hypothetical protein
MRRFLLSVFAVVLAAGFYGASTVAAQESQDSYHRPMKPRGFEARAVVLRPRKIGTTDIRDSNALAVEVQVEVQDYLPRALEPVLVIDGKPVKSRSRIVKVEGDTTTIGFVLEKPDQMKDDAKLSVQMGDEEQTRARVPGELRFDKIKPLDKDDSQQLLNLPSLSDWLKGKP